MRSIFGVLICGAIFLLAFACGKTDNIQGHNLYDQHCANCHFEEGTGLRQLMPPLAGSDFLRDYQKEVVRAMRFGLAGAIQVNGITYNEVMPGNKELSEFQIVNIVNYINQAWGNNYGRISVEDTRKWLAE